MNAEGIYEILREWDEGIIGLLYDMAGQTFNDRCEYLARNNKLMLEFISELHEEIRKLLDEIYPILSKMHQQEMNLG